MRHPKTFPCFLGKGYGFYGVSDVKVWQTFVSHFIVSIRKAMFNSQGGELYDKQHSLALTLN